MTERPDFLKDNANLNGADLIAAFRKLTVDEAAAVDRWLLVTSVYGAVT